MTGKTYISAEELVRDSFTLARRIYDSGFRPEIVVVLWRGGTPIGIVVHEFLLYKGISTYHTVLKAESYDGQTQLPKPHIEHLDAVLDVVGRESRVLVVDDIFDTGRTMETVLTALRTRTDHVRTATLYRHTRTRQSGREPDYFLRETDRWIVFPHELVGLTEEEIRRKKIGRAHV